MSYKTIKTYFQRRLAAFNLQEAKVKTAWLSSTENFDNQFIFENPKTELDDGDTLNHKFFPKREIKIHTAHKTSENSLLFDYDSVHTRLENVLRDLHSAKNYRSDGIKRIVFNSLNVSIRDTYIAGEMTFTVEDTLDYVT
ncbi:MAG: hypothetical protein BWY42_00957 [Candidatus Omnitrophica bacterium ADurb.Bin277]|nr:MAG: hypothetical protein BWY42_00957 [Candidatus Omnitrophica bacterium ADurb.Bin277]